VTQMGTAPDAEDADFAAWSFAMVTDGLGAGGTVIVRPADNADYITDEVANTSATAYETNWGTPSGAYVQDTSVGSGNERVYTRQFSGGKVWFNPTAGELTATGGPTLAARTGQFVAASAGGPVKGNHRRRRAA
jgi:hypothetical protein